MNTPQRGRTIGGHLDPGRHRTVAGDASDRAARGPSRPGGGAPLVFVASGSVLAWGYMLVDPGWQIPVMVVAVLVALAMAAQLRYQRQRRR